METPVVRPDTINQLRFATDAALAMLAGMELDPFTPLKDGPLTTKEIASATGTKEERLRLLLWSLVAAGLLTEKEGRFANTDEANHFLVKGCLLTSVHARKPRLSVGAQAKKRGLPAEGRAAGQDLFFQFAHRGFGRVPAPHQHVQRRGDSLPVGAV